MKSFSIAALAGVFAVVEGFGNPYGDHYSSFKLGSSFKDRPSPTLSPLTGPKFLSAMKRASPSKLYGRAKPRLGRPSPSGYMR